MFFSVFLMLITAVIIKASDLQTPLNLKLGKSIYKWGKITCYIDFHQYNNCSKISGLLILFDGIDILSGTMFKALL